MNAPRVAATLKSKLGGSVANMPLGSAYHWRVMIDRQCFLSSLRITRWCSEGGASNCTGALAAASLRARALRSATCWSFAACASRTDWASRTYDLICQASYHASVRAVCSSTTTEYVLDS